MATRRDIMIGAAAVGLSPVMVSGTPGTALSAEGKMVLCIHSNTSAAAGYRGAAERKPLVAAGASLAGVRRIWRNEQHIWPKLAPFAAEPDEIGAVGAVTVQQHHDLLGQPARTRRQQRPREFDDHRAMPPALRKTTA